MLSEIAINLLKWSAMLAVFILGPACLIFRSSRIIFKIGISLLFLAGLITTFILWNAPEISIVNRSVEPIQELVITGNNFKKTIARLQPGQSSTFRVYPRGESGLSVKFRTKKGNFVSDEELAYLTRGGNNHLFVEIDNNYKVSVSMKF